MTIRGIVHKALSKRSARRRWVVGAALVVVVLAIAMTALAQTGTLTADWFSINGGGGTSSGGNFTLDGTIGQPDAGTISGGRFTVRGGFQAGLSGDVQSVVPADCNNDGALNAADITAVVLEIFDGDGASPEDAHMGAFAGTPGCDSNEDETIGAADITCVVLLIFGASSACGQDSFSQIPQGPVNAYYQSGGIKSHFRQSPSNLRGSITKLQADVNQKVTLSRQRFL